MQGPNWEGKCYLAYVHPDNLPLVERMIAAGVARYGQTLKDGTVILEIDD